MKKTLTTVSLFLLVSSAAFAQQALSPRAKDEAAVRAAVASIAEGWTAGDGRAVASSFAEDADFTVWNGIYIKGREEIARGHEQILSTRYKGTKLRLDVRGVRFLRDDVAVVHAEGRMAKKEDEFTAEPQAVPVIVLAKDKGRWQIVMFQNLLSQQEQTRRESQKSGR